MKILIKFPSRSRPEKFFKTVDNIFAHLANKQDYLISATLDDNDLTMRSVEALRKIDMLEKTINFEVVWGRSRNKVDACNRGINLKFPWDIVVLISDDMQIIAHGFDDLIRRDFKMEDSLDRVIHYKDGFEHDPIISFPVIGRLWFNHYGYIYPPMYISLFCDEELYLVAQQRGKLYTSDFNIVKHNHPTWIGGVVDAQLRGSESFHPIDKQTFEKRKRNNFFIK